MRIASLAAALVAVCVFAGSCRRGSDRATAPDVATQVSSVPVNSDRFPHDLHTGDDPRIRGYKQRGLACTDCHPADAVLAGEPARPGLNQHAPCDDCHKQAFYEPPGLFCKNCHIDVQPRVQGATTMQPYPERGFTKVLAARFSHRLHLDAATMEAAVGFHVSCRDCHQRDPDSRDPTLPGHGECARCHGEKPGAQQAFAMGQCDSCHPKRDVNLARGRIFITGDLVFSHATHVTDAAGQPIACDTCHDDIEGSRSVEDASVPAMQRCAICHEDAQKTPEDVRIANCGVCHTQIDAGNAPRSHLVGKQVPESHTLEFRIDHGEQAADAEARCGFCHEGLSGSPRDSCFECHQLMEPRDHTIGWRDDTHGREAGADRDRCATCHVADYCTACHAIPPRSHQPLGEFRLGGHAQPARFDLGGCFACHTFEDTCSRCHRSIR